MGSSIHSGVVATGWSIAYSFRKVNVRVRCGSDSPTIADLGVIRNKSASRFMMHEKPAHASRPRQLTRACNRPPSAREIVGILKPSYAARLGGG